MPRHSTRSRPKDKTTISHNTRYTDKPQGSNRVKIKFNLTVKSVELGMVQVHVLHLEKGAVIVRRKDIMRDAVFTIQVKKSAIMQTKLKLITNSKYRRC